MNEHERQAVILRLEQALKQSGAQVVNEVPAHVMLALFKSNRDVVALRTREPLLLAALEAAWAEIRWRRKWCIVPGGDNPDGDAALEDSDRLRNATDTTRRALEKQDG